MLVRRVSCCLRQEFPPVDSRGQFLRPDPGKDTLLTDLWQGACDHDAADCSGDLPKTPENRASDPRAVFVSAVAESVRPVEPHDIFASAPSAFPDGSHPHIVKLTSRAVLLFRAPADSCIFMTPTGRTK